MPTDKLESEIDNAINEIVEEKEQEETEASDKEEKVAPDTTGEKEDTTELVDTDEAGDTKEADAAGEETGREEEVETDGAGDTEEDTSAPVVISDEALTRAAAVGIPVADARNFPSEEALTKAAAALEQVLDEVADYRPRETGLEKALKETEEKEVDPFANLPKLDPDTYEPEVIQTYDKIIEVVKQQHEKIKSLEGRQVEVSEVTQAQAAAEVGQWFDRQVAGLGKDFEEALGAGAFDSLSQGSSQYAKRDAIARQMSTLLAGYQAQGQQAPSREEVFNVAAGQVLQDEYRQIHERELQENLEKQASQHMQRVGGGKAKSKLSPEAETAAEIDAQFFG